jgi:hypothetical protein
MLQHGARLTTLVMNNDVVNLDEQRSPLYNVVVYELSLVDSSKWSKHNPNEEQHSSLMTATNMNYYLFVKK